MRVEHVDDPLMQKIRYLDKLVDELAKGQVDGHDLASVTVSGSSRAVAWTGHLRPRGGRLRLHLCA